MKHTSTLLLAMAVALGASNVQAQDVSPFLGTYKTEGKQGLRKVEADIEVTRADDGTITVERTGRFTSRRHRRDPEFIWKTTDARLDGDTLKVVFRMTKDGVPVSMADSGGLVTGLDGGAASPNATDSSGNSVDPNEINVIEVEYSLDGDRVEEKLKNVHRRDAEDYWRRGKTKGDKLSSPVADVKRVKLGETAEVKPNTTYTIVVPTDGTLGLELTSGTPKLEDPSGNAVALTQDGNTHELEIPHKAPVLGRYKLTVEGADAGTMLEVSFVQDGRIDPRIRPWSSHTYYPIYEEGYGGSENDKTLFRKDGPLEKFDTALKLEGKESAVWWEKGTDYRTGFGFERGHYTKVQSPSEKHAEEEWHADLDHDGVMETGTAEDAFKRLDTGADGKIDREEAKVVMYGDQIKMLWSNYDGNGDEKVDASEIFANFVTKYDEDGSNDIDYAEWDKALRAAYTSLLDERTTKGLDELMANDADGDGFLVVADIPAPGALDFHDGSDVDGDYENFFDRDNIKITTKSGEVHYGNKVVEEDGKLKLFKGRKKDALVVELDPADVEKREDGIADGDLDDSYSVGWWGHCNAWSMASIVFRKPSEEFEHEGVKFSVRDQKGLMVEFGMGDTEDSTFWWQQFGGEEIPPSKYATAFHQQMHRWLRVEQQGMMADMDLKDPNNSLNFQVWNYPLLGYVATITEAEGDDPYVLDVSCKIEKGSYADEDSSSTATVKYRLQFKSDGSLDDGDESKAEWQPGATTKEYIRYLMHPFRFTSRGKSGNPNVSLERLEKVFGERLKYNRIADIEAEEAAAGGLGANTAPGANTTPGS